MWCAGYRVAVWYTVVWPRPYAYGEFASYCILNHLFCINLRISEFYCPSLWLNFQPLYFSYFYHVDFQGWGENDRGVSFTFGPDVVVEFLNRHELDLVVRAHQVVEDGYEFFAKRELVTVFSAPNYCGEFDNAGAMMTVDDTLMCSFQILKPASAAQQRAQAQSRNGRRW